MKTVTALWHRVLRTCQNLRDMPRLTTLLFAGLFLLGSLVALSCGGGDKNDVAAMRRLDTLP